MSSQHPHTTEAARHYESAYRIHQDQDDLLRAFLAYDRVIQQHPDTPEAGFARHQMRNIVRSTVPADELWASQYQLALRFLQPQDEAELARETQTTRTSS